MARRSGSFVARYKTTPDGRTHATASEARNALHKGLEERKAWATKFEPESLDAIGKAIGDLRGAPVSDLKVGSFWGRSLSVGGMTFVYKIERIA